MGREDSTPSWFWPTFAVGTTFAVGAIVASGIGGAWLLGLRASSVVPSHRPRAYVPSFAGLDPAPPPSYVGQIAIEVIVRDSYGPSEVESGERCLLALTFDGVASGEGTCHGTLRCEGERTLWSALEDRAFDCDVRTDLGTLSGDDAGEIGRSSLAVRSGGDGATLTVAGTAPDGRSFSVLATSE